MAYGRVGVVDGRRELAGGEGVEGAEAGGEFGGGQAALAVEAAEKIVSGLLPLLCVAFHAARDQVAVGIAAQPRLRHDVVQALHHRGGAAHTVEAVAALAGVDGLSQRLGLEKVCLLEIHRRGGARPLFLGGGPAFDGFQPYAANLIGQADFHDMPGFTALDHTQSAVGGETAHRLARRSRGYPDTACHPQNRKAVAEIAFEAAVTEEMGIDGAVDDREAQLRRELVFQLFPDKFGVRFFSFHGLIQMGS